jgi:ComEC/Rec2-related protein
MFVSDYLGYAGAAIVGGVGVAMLVVARWLPDWVRYGAMSLLSVGIGCADMLYSRLPDVETFAHDREWWCGELVDITENDHGSHLVVRLDSITDRQRVDALVHVSFDVVPDVVPGDVVRFHADLEAPRGDGIPDIPDYGQLLARRGIVLTGFADDVAIVGHRSSWRDVAWRVRTGASSLLLRSGLSSSTCSFLMAVLVGDDDWLTQDTRDTFSTAGVAHVLSLSGLHVGIIIMMLTLVLMPVGLLWDWRLRCGVIIVALWGYALLTGMSASVTRAALMASMVCGGIILQRPYVSFNGMLMAALLILVVAPQQLFLPGFQLSFLAVGCILLLMPVVAKLTRPLPRAMQWAVSTVAISVVAMLGTALLALYYFDIFPVYFLLANVPIMLLLPLLMVGGVLLMLFEAIGFDPQWLCAGLDMMYGLIYGWAEYVVTMPMSAVRGARVDGVVLALYYAALGVGVAAVWRRSSGWGVAFSVCVLVVAMAAKLTAKPADELLFIPRSASTTTVVCRTATGVEMYTSAPATVAESLRAEYAVRYRTLIARSATGNFALSAERIVAVPKTGERLVIVADNGIVQTPPAGAVGADYALMCRSYRGSWRAVVDSLRPHCLLLSADIPKRRHLLLVDSISTSTTSLISLRDTTFMLP